jgi:hypothetical protein
MKFVCFCYYDTVQFANLTPEDFDAIPGACKPHDEALDASGKKALLGSFAPPETWKSVRPGDAGPSAKEGEFLKTREQIGAFFVVDAESIEEAVKIASLHPGAHLGRYFGGGIEVRPCELYEEYSA